MAVALAGPARGRRGSAGPQPARTRASSTPPAASACRCRSASDKCSRSTRSASPARSRDSTCCAAARPASSTAYMGYLERFIAEQRLPDLFLFCPAGGKRLLRIRHGHPGEAPLARDAGGGHPRRDRAGAPRRRAPRAVWSEFRTGVGTVRRRGHVRSTSSMPSCPASSRGWRHCRAREIRMTCPRVVVTGDFFTRFSPFFMEGVRDLYAERGIILKPVDLSDLSLYVTLSRRWPKPPAAGE